MSDCPRPACNEISIQEWIEANKKSNLSKHESINYIADLLTQYFCSCGCNNEQIQAIVSALAAIRDYLIGRSCPDSPLPVQDCLSEQILAQLQAINENTDELEITAQNINLNANQINLNVDEVEELLRSILGRFNQGCDNPISTEVCNPNQIYAPIVDAISTINLNTDEVERLLQDILNRLNQDCDNPLRTEVCNTEEISQPIVDALSTINLNLPPRPVLDCDLNPTGDEVAGVTVVGVVQNRPCPAPNLSTLGLTLNANQSGTIPPNVKSWTVIVFEGSATVNGQPNILAGTTIKGGGYSDGSRVGPIPLATNAGSRLVAFWEI